MKAADQMPEIARDDDSYSPAYNQRNNPCGLDFRQQDWLLCFLLIEIVQENLPGDAAGPSFLIVVQKLISVWIPDEERIRV